MYANIVGEDGNFQKPAPTPMYFECFILMFMRMHEFVQRHNYTLYIYDYNIISYMLSNLKIY